MFKLYRQLTICLFLLLAASGTALAESLLISPHVYHHELSPYLEYLEDTEGQLEIEDILLDHKSSKNWTKNTKQVPNMGMTNSVFWFRLTISNPTEYSIVRLLELSYPLLNSVSLYQFEGGQLIANYIAGHSISFHARPIEHRHLVFPLELTAKTESQVYLRVESKNGIQMPLDLWEERVFWSQDQARLSWQFLYYGLMIVMIGYNLFLATVMRDKIYLYYVFTMTFICGFQAILHGAAYQFLWPGLPEWNALSMAVITPLSNAFSCLFSMQMLRTQTGIGYVHTVLRGCTAVSLTLALLAIFLPYRVVIVVSAAAVVMSAIVVCIACFKTWASNKNDARIFTAAWFIFVVGCMVMFLNKFSLLPYTWFTENLLQITSGISTILLSLALAERINRLRDTELILKKHQLDTREREIMYETELLEASRGQIRK
ncbi:MAG: hypothetical protein CSA49_06945 [Gammaproteobacteria bacterium]|nr:MAG: hypothetical protein CSA49_06945 [Gammaproteobacteria bacterium]